MAVDPTRFAGPPTAAYAEIRRVPGSATAPE
jgi:hypothetical protein